MENSGNYVEFVLLRGHFEASYLRDKNQKKLYTSVEDAKKAGVPENSPLIVRWNDGRPVGRIELSERTKRILRIDKSEKAVIEGLCYHEFVNSPISKSNATKVTFRDTASEKEITVEKINKQNIADSVFINLETEEIEDLGVLLGYQADDAYTKLSELKRANPDLFMSYFKEPFKLKGSKAHLAKLKEETIVGAILKRALNKKVVTAKSGAIFYEDTQIGIDFNKTVANLMDTTKQGHSGILPLIKQKLAEAL